MFLIVRVSRFFETTIRLAEIPNIVASKEAHADLDHMTQMIRQLPQDFKVYSGDDSITLPVLAIGGYGIVSVASHLIGAEMKQMVQLLLDGAVAGAAELHAKLFPIFKGLFRVPSPAPIKHALNLRGLNVGGVRLPMIAVTAEEGLWIESLLG